MDSNKESQVNAGDKFKFNAENDSDIKNDGSFSSIGNKSKK